MSKNECFFGKPLASAKLFLILLISEPAASAGAALLRGCAAARMPNSGWHRNRSKRNSVRRDSTQADSPVRSDHAMPSLDQMALGDSGGSSSCAPEHWRHRGRIGGEDDGDEAAPDPGKRARRLSREHVMQGIQSGAMAIEASTKTRARRQLEAREANFEKMFGADSRAAIERQGIEFMRAVGMARRGWVLHPDKARFLQIWDFITTLALLYTATVTPFETAFIPAKLGPVAWRDLWFLSNRALDVIFLTDMGLQFFVAYQVGNDYAGYTWVTSHCDIVRHYLCSWFVFDATTVFLPGSFDLMLTLPQYAVVTSADLPPTTGGTAADKMGMLRVLRALRLMKLGRLVKASRVFKRWCVRGSLQRGRE